MQTSVVGDEPSLCSWTIISSRENSSWGFNMQLMAHLIAYSSLHFRLAVSPLCSLSPALIGFSPRLTLSIWPNLSSRSLAFSYLFAELICNTALTHRPDNEVETSCNSWMKSTAIVFQLFRGRESGHVTGLAKQNTSGLPGDTNTEHEEHG